MKNSKMSLAEIDATVKGIHNKMYSISPCKTDNENINIALDVVLGIARLPRKYQIIFGWAYLEWYDLSGPGRYPTSALTHCANIISTSIDYFTDGEYDEDSSSSPCAVCGEDDEDSNGDSELY